MAYHLTDINWEPNQGFNVRDGLVFSDIDLIRLHPTKHKIQLKRNSAKKYSTDPDISARSRTYTPTAVRKLKYLQVFATVPADCGIGLRIYDGTDELWWDGDEWIAAATGEWNTEAEINANLATYPVTTTREFGVVLNLTTTDKLFTPEVAAVRIAWEGDVEEIDDVLVDGLTKKLQDGLTWIEEAPLPPTIAPGSTINLTQYRDEQGIILAATGILAVYDHTTDPNHLINLFSSFNPSTHIITLTGSLPSGRVPWVRLIVPPLVAYDTDADFSTLPRLPAVELQHAEVVRGTQLPGGGIGVGDKATGDAIAFPAYYRLSYRIRGSIITDGTARRPMRIAGKLISLIQSEPFVHAPAIDQRYRLQLEGGISATTIGVEGDRNDIRSHQFELYVHDVLTTSVPPFPGYIVKQVVTDIGIITQ